MKLEAVSLAVQPPQPQSQVGLPERRSQELLQQAHKQTVRDERKVASEGILDKITALTEDGLYSVRFEKNEELDALVIKLVDSSTGELIRQIPSEELLGATKQLRELRGNMINTES